MAERTEIGWATSTWNPWMGCTKISAGCANCYALAQIKRFHKERRDAIWRTKDTTFKAPYSWSKKVAKAYIFTCSMSDFFHERVSPDWRNDAWQVIRETPNLCYMILTKRPWDIRPNLPDDWGNGYHNVWLGTTAENQAEAENRISYLLDVPATKHFVSCEPLLGHVVLGLDKVKTIDWVIAGGESGPKARPMELSWARHLRDECVTNDVPFFFKQLGGHPDKRAGNKAVLDGRTWTQRPEFTLKGA